MARKRLWKRWLQVKLQVLAVTSMRMAVFWGDEYEDGCLLG
jgi:hypothetical protein